MATSVIYTASSAANAVTANSVIPLGNTIRRFGKSISNTGTSIVTKCPGYYTVHISAVVSPTVAGNVGIALYDNGTLITGAMANATTTAATQPVNLVIEAVVRVNCSCVDGNLTVVLTGEDSSVINIAAVVEKL